MTHDNTGAVIPKFKSIGATRIAGPRQVVFALDHDIQKKGEKNMEKYANIGAFLKEMGIGRYSPLFFYKMFTIKINRVILKKLNFSGDC